jgi:hypothetical protein
MQPVTGYIRTGERIPNTARRFGAALEYIVVHLLQPGQEPQPVLLTVEQIRDGVDRAKTNPEDCPPFEPEQARIDRAVAIAQRDERARFENERVHLVASMQAERKAAVLRASWKGWAIGSVSALVGCALGVLL